MKKLVSGLLSLAMLAVLAAPAAAATNTIKGVPKIGRIHDTCFYNYEGNASINPEQTRPGDEIIIPLVAKGFEEEGTGAVISWDGDTLETTMLGPSLTDLKVNKVIPRILFTAGKELIRDVEIVKYTPTRRVRARSAIRIRFVEHLASTQEKNYEFRVGLDHEGSISEYGTLVLVRETFGGMMANERLDISPGYTKNLDYVDTQGDIVLNCIQSTDNVVADLGNGVRAHLDMVQGGKFYGYSDTLHTQNQVDPVYRDKDVRESRDAIVDTYAEIKIAYTVTSINVKNMLKYMKLTQHADEVYYVYNEYGEYIGKSNENLPYSTRYYLADKEVEIDPDLAGKPVYSVDEKEMGAELKRFLNKA